MNAEIRTTLKDHNEEQSVAHFSFSVKDARGREIGARIVTGVHEFVPVAEDEGYDRSFYTVAPGRYFRFRPHATRDGKTYGAVQANRYFNTAEERDAAIQKYLAQAAARATKK